MNVWNKALTLPANCPNKNSGAFGYGNKNSYVNTYKRKQEKKN